MIEKFSHCQNCIHQSKYPDCSLLLLSYSLLAHLLNTSRSQRTRKSKWCSPWRSGPRIQAGRVGSRIYLEREMEDNQSNVFAHMCHSYVGKFPRTGIAVSVGRKEPPQHPFLSSPLVITNAQLGLWLLRIKTTFPSLLCSQSNERGIVIWKRLRNFFER